MSAKASVTATLSVLSGREVTAEEAERLVAGMTPAERRALDRMREFVGRAGAIVAGLELVRRVFRGGS